MRGPPKASDQRESEDCNSNARDPERFRSTPGRSHLPWRRCLWSGVQQRTLDIRDELRAGGVTRIGGFRESLRDHTVRGGREPRIELAHSARFRMNDLVRKTNERF